MKLRRRCGFGVAVALGLGVLGCQIPFSKTQSSPRLDKAHPTAPSERKAEKKPELSERKPEKPEPSGPAKASDSEDESARKFRKGIHPPDSLPPCRPAGGQKPISVTRFLENLEPTRAEFPAENPPTKAERQFEIPKVFPGAQEPTLKLPQMDPNAPFAERRAKIGKIYKPLPQIPEFPFSPGETGLEPISLAKLQELAYANSPKLQAAIARVEQARGQAIQVGLYPNPEVGYESDTVGTNASAGYHGMFVYQTVVTADKLKLSRSVELQEVVKSEYALRRVQIDLATAVRTNYFIALIAQERLKFTRELADLFRRTYEGQIDLVVGGESAPYEPLQIRVFAVEAQNAAILAGNDYVASWRRLAAVLNLPGFAPRMLEGYPEMPVPDISHDLALQIMLARHTDVSIAQAQIAKSHIDLNLQQVTPIPNVNLVGVVQYDATTPLDDVTYNFNMGFVLPIFNKNQGNIYTAQSQIIESQQNLTGAQNTLAGQLAEIYARYASNRALTRNYRNEILPDQVQTYRGVYQRFRQGVNNIDFAQVIVTQQQLGQTINQYLNVLSAQWQAVVDLAEVLQADNLFALDSVAPPSGPPAPLNAPLNPPPLAIPPEPAPIKP